MLPKLELEVIVEESREVSVGDLEDEESSHLVDKEAAAKLAKSLPASADIAIFGEEAPTPAPLALASAAGAEFTDEDHHQEPLGNGDLLPAPAPEQPKPPNQPLCSPCQRAELAHFRAQAVVPSEGMPPVASK